MKFSIVTISFNQVDYLKRCIDSVISQRGVTVEYIIMDPGSTDGSRELIASYGDKISIVDFSLDAGPADGLNKGFSRASGDLLGFLNSDDEFLPDALINIQNTFIRNRKIDIVTGCGYFVDADGFVLKSIVPSKISAWLYTYGATTIFQQGTFFTRDIYKKINGFNIQNKTCWDGELFLDMAMAGANHLTIDEDIALFRLHGASITGSGRLNEKYAMDGVRLFTKATGRSPCILDKVQAIFARLAKPLRDPAYIFRRLKRYRSMPIFF